MPFRLTEAAWLERETERVKGTLLVALDPGREYTVEQLLAILGNRGLSYTPAVCQEIGQRLIAEGILEQTPGG